MKAYFSQYHYSSSRNQILLLKLNLDRFWSGTTFSQVIFSNSYEPQLPVQTWYNVHKKIKSFSFKEVSSFKFYGMCVYSSSGSRANLMFSCHLWGIACHVKIPHFCLFSVFSVVIITSSADFALSNGVHGNKYGFWLKSTFLKTGVLQRIRCSCFLLLFVLTPFYYRNFKIEWRNILLFLFLFFLKFSF